MLNFVRNQVKINFADSFVAIWANRFFVASVLSKPVYHIFRNPLNQFSSFADLQESHRRCLQKLPAV